MHSQKLLRFVVAIIALTGFLTTLLVARSTADSSAGGHQEIERFIRRHESLELDAVQAARQVRESGRLLLATPSQSFDLDLTPNDLRAANYRAEEVIDGNVVRSVAMVAAHTFRGTVRGMAGVEARFTVDEEKIEGVIITPAERYYVEPLRNYKASSGRSDYVLYKGSDVIEGAHGACATTLDGRLNGELERLFPRTGDLPLTAGDRQVDMATEADYEYVTYFGSSAAANTEILSIMNQVDGLFHAEFGVTFRITYQHTWATAGDPYSATTSDGILNEFTNYWNANISQPRDLAHMWTDKVMDGGYTIGIAWLSTLCRDQAHSYGVSLRVVDGLKYSIAAHEIGHNFGASHPDQQVPPVTACAGTVMNSAVGAFDFCQFSQNEMNAYLGGNSGCLVIASTNASVQFSAANYPANENAGSAVITVTRVGDVAGAVNVDYATSNGTASLRTDYVGASGTLRFAPGETSKTFSVLLVDDLYVEGNEAINLSLTNPLGAAFGAQNSATLTITDNDSSPPATNPLDDPQFFVRQHYLDFLNREPDAGGLGYWSSLLTQCGADTACLNARHTDVSAAFFLSAEFQETGFYVYRIYKAALGRRPNFDEFATDRGRVVANPDLPSSKQSLAADFVARPAFFAQFPAGISPEQYVDQLNANTGFSLTQTERDALVNGMRNGTEVRATVLRQVAENQLFRQRESNSAFVLMQYFGYLRRDPEQGGYDYWLSVLNNQPNNFRGMVCAFLTSAEYQARFSSIITRSNAECSQ